MFSVTLLRMPLVAMVTVTSLRH